MEMAFTSGNMNFKYILIGSIFCLIITFASVVASDANSSQYFSQATEITGGVEGNASSQTYITRTTIGDTIGSSNSSTYTSAEGFEYALGGNITNTESSPGTPGGGSSQTPSGGGGGGGNGLTAVPKEQQTIIITPEKLEILVNTNTPATRTLQITNNGTKSATLKIGIIGKDLENVLSTDSEITLNPLETKLLSLHISPIQKGLLTGEILFVSENITKSIPITINVRTENFLFDASIVLAEKYHQIYTGDILNAHIKLLQVGPHEKVDVTVKYFIKDYQGKQYSEGTETFFVLQNKEYNKIFFTKNLPAGKYILGIEVSYPDALATASAEFEILPGKREPSLLEKGVFWYLLIASALVVVVTVKIVTVLKDLQRKQLLVPQQHTQR